MIYAIGAFPRKVGQHAVSSKESVGSRGKGRHS
jgi:hypothetical protein